MNTTARNKLALLSAGQSQKEVTHNEALVAIDRLLHPLVKSRSLSAPPEDPALGDSWIVGEDANGAWSGQEQAIAVFEGYGWGFVLPTPGLAAFIEDEDGMAVWRGQWSAGWPVSQFSVASPAVINLPMGGTTIDAELRESFGSLVAALQALGLTT